MRRNLAIIAVVLLVLGVLSLIGLWWALGPGAPQELSSATLPPLPSPPTSPSPPESAYLDSPRSVTPTEQPLTPNPETFEIGLLDQGRLIVAGRGQPFATDTYSLERLPSGEILLQSQGTLTFKIAFINTQATFAQAVRFDAEKRPLSYQLVINGPVGIGNRKVSASFGATNGRLSDGEKESHIELPPEPFLLLGMFSSYTILTLWADAKEAQTLKVISLRGVRGDETSATPAITVEYRGTITLKAPNGSIIAEEYLLRSERFALKLYRDGTKFLGLRSMATEKEPEGSFSVYRSDLFPQGFEVLYTP